MEQQHGVEIADAAFDIAEHLPEAGPIVDTQSAPAFVTIGPNELHAMVVRISEDGSGLFAEGLSLGLGRGTEIARGETLRGQPSRRRYGFQVRMTGH